MDDVAQLKFKQQVSITEHGYQNDAIELRLDVTFLDAFLITELNVLIVSYLLRQVHNSLVIMTPYYGVMDRFSSTYFYLGAVCGIAILAPLYDKWLSDKAHVVLCFVNFCLIFLDILVISTYQMSPYTFT